MAAALRVEDYVSLPFESGVFGPDQLGAAEAYFRKHGFAVLRNLWDENTLAEMERECADARDQVIAGTLDPRHGNTILIDDGKTQFRTANYVQYITEIAPVTRACAYHPAGLELVSRWLSPQAYMSEHSRFGVVYQDARPGRESGYARIGWHSDWQSGPHLDRWPSVAFTIHIDATSPENGFLRVVPGSHQWATPAPFRNANNVAVPEGSRPTGGYTDTPPPYDMPLGFERVRGEIPVYCERGDLLFHDAYLWHSAARATVDTAVRRHVRGGWFVGAKDSENGDYLEDFIKNAAR